jgi:DNA-binding transcriptional ArsR family regulator
MNEAVSITANLLGDPGRAAMLLSLMGGVSRPAGELAQLANVAPPTASAHLAKLVDGRLLTVERQGRRRYYRLADGDVADAIESLLVLTGRSQSSGIGATPAKAAAGSLAYARTCYAHLAGWLGVRIAESLEERRLIVQIDPKTYEVTSPGRDWFAALDVEIAAAKPDRPLRARRCLDWTERRHHLAGPPGCGLYRRLNELKWTAPLRNTRAIRVTVEGKVRLWELLRIPIG